MANLRRQALLLGTLFLMPQVLCQNFRWQQRVEYVINARLDVKTNHLTGTESVHYFNHSPDTLREVYFHLYFNAFQPGSMMDVRSRTITDPDPRVGDRIAGLTDQQIGFQHIESLTTDGKKTKWSVDGTIMTVSLPRPIPPNGETTFELQFTAQVPLQIRRSGRDNAEGIRYSMTQWYPKLAEYDDKGWHADPYVGREFYGVWGDFDVTISLDPSYVVAGTGILQNPDQVGYGYERQGARVTRPRGDLVWHFLAKDVHDFAWAADPDFEHLRIMVPGGPELHLVYQDYKENWKKAADFCVQLFEYLNQHFGKYPYPAFSVIQGGDGGMEYPMCTLITGKRSLPSLIGTIAHETSHAWYYGVLASNESLNPWMDEGFASYASKEAVAALTKSPDDPHVGAYGAYFQLVKSGSQEPMSQHADHFTTNAAYSIAAYAMGEIFLVQLKYIVGDRNFSEGMLRYFDQWKFRHPEPVDFIRVMERVSGLQLGWYLNDWLNTTKHIDYAVTRVIERDGSTFITIRRNGEMAMPVEILVSFTGGSQKLYYLPLREMRGARPVENGTQTLEAWPWVNPEYTFEVGAGSGRIESVVIDPGNRLADIDAENNNVQLTEIRPYKDPTR